MAAPKAACVLYAAKSTSDEHGSIRSQFERCREYAARNGWEIEGEYSDEAASAFKGSRGPGLRNAKALAAELATTRETVLLVYASDRLARGDGRTAAHLVEYVVEATKAGYRIEAVTEHLGGKMALVLAALYGERAHADSQAKSVHTKAGKRRAAERGRRNGGPRPFGYTHRAVVVDGKPTSVLEHVPQEAEAVRSMFEDYARGASMSTIARTLNAAGVTTVRGNDWSQPVVGQVLRNPLYRGMVRYHGELFVGQHEAIVSDELWFTVEALRKTARRRGHAGGRPPKGSHLLTNGLLRCSCGEALRPRTEQKRYGTWEAYLCAGRHSGRTTCTLPAISRADVDRAVWTYFETVALDYGAMVREADERRSLRFAETTSQLGDATDELRRAEERLERVRRDYLDGELTAEQWQHFTADLEPERDAAAAAVEQLEASVAAVRDEEELADAESQTLEAIQAIRKALAGFVTGSADLPAAREALRRVFESFTLHRYDDSISGILDADLAGGDWYIVPNVRADAILTPLVIGRDEHGEPTVKQDAALRRVTVTPHQGRTQQLSSSRR